MRFGVLNHVFATPELHRWHHSRVVEESNANYGSNVIVWDTLLGTRLRPADRAPSTDIGLPPGVAIRMNYLTHLQVPFVWSKIEAPANEAE